MHYYYSMIYSIILLVYVKTRLAYFCVKIFILRNMSFIVVNQFCLTMFVYPQVSEGDLR